MRRGRWRFGHFYCRPNPRICMQEGLPTFSCPAHIVLPFLSPTTGICLLLDVATKVTEGGTWFPVLMNFQTSKTLKSMPEFRIIAPAPCRELHGSCNTSCCYSQKRFEVKHSRASCDLSRVNYRIISRATGIALPSKQPTPCIISPPTQFRQEKQAPCSSQLESTCEKDAFPINP